MQDVQPLTPSPSLAARGAGALREMIMTGVLNPGDRLRIETPGGGGFGQPEPVQP